MFQVNDVDIKLQFPDPMKVRFESEKNLTFVGKFEESSSVCSNTLPKNWLNF